MIGLVRLYGLAGEKVQTEVLMQWLHAPAITIGGTSIDLSHLLLAILVAVASFFVGRWVRQLTYDWLYAGVTDRGVRRSLSVFSQYFVIVFGLLIAVNTAGLDLTSLAVFAGALGVGIGFGMQNIANNFLSGLILLVERPARDGDWVTIGSNEGEVTRIGIRSVTVRTWDNQEVIIPNADLLSNAFVNWTRSDPMVRTVLDVGVSYNADPHEVVALIQEGVAMQPQVAMQPAPFVLLTNFGESSVDFRVYYYVDVSQFSRVRVKSGVLFAIWDALKEAGIEIPFPQRDVRIRELPPDVAQTLRERPDATPGQSGLAPAT